MVGMLYFTNPRRNLTPTHSTHAAMQRNDIIHIGYLAGGAYGDHEESVLLTFDTDKGGLGHVIEVAIPKTAWEAFKAVAAVGHGRVYID